MRRNATSKAHVKYTRAWQRGSSSAPFCDRMQDTPLHLFLCIMAQTTQSYVTKCFMGSQTFDRVHFSHKTPKIFCQFDETFSMHCM
jgi:hypothetical protein